MKKGFIALEAYLFIFLVVGLVIFGVVVVGGWIYTEMHWSSLPTIEQRATLENCNFRPSTLKNHITPIFSGNGKMHMAVTATGHEDIYTTVWNCGPYGRITCDEEEVFRYAQEEATLLIKVWNEHVRIVGYKT